jgi:hypothetical protein
VLEITHFVQPLDDLVIILAVALDHARHRIHKPLLELLVGLKDVRHQEVHQRPQLHQIVLEWRARQQQPSANIMVRTTITKILLHTIHILKWHSLPKPSKKKKKKKLRMEKTNTGLYMEREK